MDIKNKNYNTLIMASLRDLQETFPEMTFGQILYSFLRLSILPENISTDSLRVIREIDDETIYNAIERTIKIEQEEE